MGDQGKQGVPGPAGPTGMVGPAGAMALTCTTRPVESAMAGETGDEMCAATAEFCVLAQDVSVTQAITGQAIFVQTWALQPCASGLRPQGISPNWGVFVGDVVTCCRAATS